MSIQTLPEAGGRLVTGPLKVGQDWPGVFIRGDEALAFASALSMAADCIERGDNLVAIATWLRSEAAKLCSVKTNS